MDRSRRVLVLSHKDADGDTIGSALALYDVLRNMGKEAVVRVPPPVPAVYSFLPDFGAINTDGGGAFDLVVVVDASNLERVAESMRGVEDGVPIVNIDHHVSNTNFGDVNLVVPEASSTAEVTFDLLQDWGVPTSPAAAANLYCGVLTDTGGFRHDNTSYKALTTAAELVACGADPALIAAGVYKSKPISTIKLQALTMATITFELDDRLVHGYVSQDHLRRAGALMEESEGIIDLLNSVEGIQAAVLFKEMGPGQTKISIRGRAPLDSTELAAAFGGGGHERAAGAELALPLEDAMAQVLPVARRMVEAASA